MLRVTCLKDGEGFCTMNKGILRFWKVSSNGDVSEVDLASPNDNFELTIED